MTPEAYARFCHALEEFNAAAFFACHDTLEALWLADPTPWRRLYQGILQVAAAFVHWQRQEYAGIVPLLDRGLEALAPFPDRTAGIDLAKLRRDVASLRGRFHREGPAALQTVRPEHLPRIEVRSATAAELPED